MRSPDLVVRADTTPPDDTSGTPFAHLDVRTLIGRDRQGSQMASVGRTVYPARGGTHEHHRHAHAEEIVIVLSGNGWHRIGDDFFAIGPGDVVFVPIGAEHSAGTDGDEDMVILWILGGANSIESAGYESVATALPPQ